MENNGTSKEKLLTWARESTGESVHDFTSCWFDGKVLAGLLFKFITDIQDVTLNKVKNNYNDKVRLDFVLSAFHEKLKVQPLLSAEEISKRLVDENCMTLYVFLIFKASREACNPTKSNGKTLVSQSSSDSDKNWKQAFKKWGKNEITFQQVADTLEKALKSVDDNNLEKNIRSFLFLVYDNEAFKLQCNGSFEEALNVHQKAFKLYEPDSDDTEKNIIKQKIAVVEKLIEHTEDMKTSEKNFLKNFRKTTKRLDVLCDEQKFSEALKFYFTVSHDVVTAASRDGKLASDFSRIFLTIAEGIKREDVLSKKDIDKKAQKFCNDSSFGGTFKDCTIHLHSNYNGNS